MKKLNPGKNYQDSFGAVCSHLLCRAMLLPLEAMSGFQVARAHLWSIFEKRSEFQVDLKQVSVEEK